MARTKKYQNRETALHDLDRWVSEQNDKEMREYLDALILRTLINLGKKVSRRVKTP
jgi:hypothetical protein